MNGLNRFGSDAILTAVGPDLAVNGGIPLPHFGRRIRVRRPPSNGRPFVSVNIEDTDVSRIPDHCHHS